MIKLNDEELKKIMGGGITSYLSATFLNAAARAINTVLDLGRTLGSTIRRTLSGQYCKIDS